MSSDDTPITPPARQRRERSMDELAAQLQALIQIDIDRGVQPFVVDSDGHQLPFSAQALQLCGCTSGQAVTEEQIDALCAVAHAELHTVVALLRAKGPRRPPEAEPGQPDAGDQQAG